MASAAAVLLVAACLVREDNDLAAFLRWKPLAWIGTVSFGIYLCHMLAVNGFRRGCDALFQTTSPLADFVGGTVLSVAIASFSYRTFEAFSLRRKERWFGEKQRGAAQPTDAASAIGGRALPLVSWSSQA